MIEKQGRPFRAGFGRAAEGDFIERRTDKTRRLGRYFASRQKRLPDEGTTTTLLLVPSSVGCVATAVQLVAEERSADSCNAYPDAGDGQVSLAWPASVKMIFSVGVNDWIVFSIQPR